MFKNAFKYISVLIIGFYLLITAYTLVTGYFELYTYYQRDGSVDFYNERSIRSFFTHLEEIRKKYWINEYEKKLRADINNEMITYENESKLIYQCTEMGCNCLKEKTH